MVYMSMYSIIVLGSDLRWLPILNGYRINIKVVILDKIYNFAINNFFIRALIVSNMQIRFKIV